MEVLVRRTRESFVVVDEENYFYATKSSSSRVDGSNEEWSIYELSGNIPVLLTQEKNPDVYRRVYGSIINFSLGEIKEAATKVVGKPRGRRGGRRKKEEVLVAA